MVGLLETNPFTYGSPLASGEGIPRPAEQELLLRMALSGQNTRMSAPRRYGKTTLIADVRAAAERLDLNTVRVDLYGVMSRAEVALRLEHGYRNLRGPFARSIHALLPRTRVRAVVGGGPARVEAQLDGAREAIDRQLIDLLDLPLGFFARKAVRTLVVFDEFQDVLQAGDGVDAVIRSRIQHQREAASYLFAGSHPGMLDELFGDRNRPLYDQARPVVLRPLGELIVAEYVEEHFRRTARSAGRALDELVALAGGHPQRVMLLAHHLWEHTPRGERADDDAWQAAVAIAFSELQEQYERAWSGREKDGDRAVLAAVAAGRPVLAAATLRDLGLSKSTAVRSRERLLRDADLQRDGDDVQLVDPLYAAWIAAGRRAPCTRLAEVTPAIDDVAIARRQDHGAAPFGSPDGERESLGELAGGYVELDGTGRTQRARVIVGGKGAGKTMMLRRLRAAVEQDRSRYAASGGGIGALATEDIVRVASWHDATSLPSVWSALWRVGLLSSVVSHLLHAPALARYRVVERHPSLATGSGERVPVSPSQALTTLLRECRTSRELAHLLDDPRWAELEWRLGDVLRDVPPLYFYIDAIDEEFARAPRFWVPAQQGLCTYAMRLPSVERLRGRVHLVVSIRDVAFVALRSGEHLTRWIGDPAIYLLRWDRERIGRLLDAKLRGLEDRFLLRPQLGATLESWLGLRQIESSRRGSVEPVADYMLRHTRLMPRDVVTLGNALCGATAQAKSEGRDALNPTEVRVVVSRVARWVGHEQLALAASHLASLILPEPQKEASNIHERWSNTGQTAERTMRELHATLSTVGTDRFDAATMQALGAEAARCFGDDRAVLTALWQNRLLGFIEGDVTTGETVFFDEGPDSDVELPSNADGYALHPVLLDLLDAQPVGAPVAQ